AKRPPVETLLRNVYFDTCVYHQPGVELLTRVVPVENILFASEMIGAVKGRNPDSGDYFDDTKKYLDACTQLSGSDRRRIFEGNARRVYPRLDASLRKRGT
ncbi:MAG: amidohydrolase family protein, partial [Steroidobacteraceae bacterium]